MKRCVAVFLALLVTVVVAWGQIQTSGVQESPLANDVISLVPDYHPSNGMKIRMFVTPYRAVRAFTQWRVHPDSTWAPVYSGLSDTAWADTTGTTDYIMKDIQTGQTDSTIYTQVLLERGGLTSPWLEGPSVTVTDTFPVLYTMYGNAVDGGTMTIAGANFKAKDPAAPLAYTTFDEFADGYAPQSSDGWNFPFSANPRPQVDTDNPNARIASNVLDQYYVSPECNGGVARYAQGLGRIVGDFRQLYMTIWTRLSWETCSGTPPHPEAAWCAEGTYQTDNIKLINFCSHALIYQPSPDRCSAIDGGYPQCRMDADGNFNAGVHLYTQQFYGSYCYGSWADYCVPGANITTTITPTMMQGPAEPNGEWVRHERYLFQPRLPCSPSGKISWGRVDLTPRGSPWSVQGVTAVVAGDNAAEDTLRYDRVYFGHFIRTSCDAYGHAHNLRAHRLVDEAYIDTTQARIEIGNAPTWAASTHREIQIPTTWNASGSGAFTVNQGSFPSGPGSPFAYVYLVDKYGTVSNGLPIRFGFTISKRDLEGGYEIVPMEE